MVMYAGCEKIFWLHLGCKNNWSLGITIGHTTLSANPTSFEEHKPHGQDLPSRQQTEDILAACYAMTSCMHRIIPTYPVCIHCRHHDVQWHPP